MFYPLDVVFFLRPLPPQSSTPTLSPLKNLSVNPKVFFHQFHPFPPPTPASLSPRLRYLRLQLSFISSGPRPAHHLFSPFLIPFFCLLVLTWYHTSMAALRHINVTFIPFFPSFLPTPPLMSLHRAGAQGTTFASCLFLLTG